jgi:uncharacterized protein DUF262
VRNIQKTVFKLADFLDWQRNGTLVLSPAFQRRPVWSKAAKSFLVDTVVRAIPIPIIFLRTRTDLKSLSAIREVVDGQQRLRTLLAFIDPGALADFDPARDSFTMQPIHNADLAGRSFADLPSEVRRSILEYDMSVHILPSDTGDREVLQIFSRMNSTGLKLNDQELRNAEFFGAFKETVYELAVEQLDRWRAWQIFSETDIARMQEVEETSDCVITMLRGVHGKNQKLIDDTYREFDEAFPRAAEVSKRFRHVMDGIEQQLGRDMSTLAFRRKPLFHTLFTFYYDLTFGLDSTLKRAKAKPVARSAAEAVRTASDAITSGELSADLDRLLRGATGHMPSRTARLEFLKQSFARVKGK